MITFSFRSKELASIPRLAKENGLYVIAGIWTLEADEVRLAEDQAQYVDAYCVGHNGLAGGLYMYEDLRRRYRSSE